MSFKQTEMGLIPSDWEVDVINNLKSSERNSISMGPFGSKIKKENFIDCGVPVIRGINLKNFEFLEDDFVFVSEEKAEELKASWVKQKDIVITHRGTLGQVGFVPENSKFKKYIVSQSGMKLTCDEDKIDSKFLYYYLNSKVGQYFLLMNKSQVGVPAIAQASTSFKKIPVPLPIIKEQKAIANVLSSLDGKIETNNQINKKLEEMAKSIFKYWFVDFEFPNDDGEPYKSSGGEMVESELGLIPKGWKVNSIGDILELAYGKALKKENRQEGLIPVYGSNGIIGYHNEAIVNGPGIVIGRKGNPGTVIYVHEDFYPIDTTFYVVPKTEINEFGYLYWFLKHQNLSNLSADSAVPGLSRNIAYMNKILIPDKSLIIKFEETLLTINKEIFNKNKENQVFTNIRDTLLPKLMSGEIRVLIES
jgi:type I restriction enzyme, S subunit